MPNTFLFIIPLTPSSHLTSTRAALRKLCFDSLLKQNYSNWKALIIGKITEEEKPGKNFLHLDFEGHKEEKLQKATEYVLNSESVYDYIIRLDDDDVFNPSLLKKLENKNFDLCVDKYHSFWDVSTGNISQKIMYWFPNTCIHKREYALSVFGNFPPGNYQRFRNHPFLIENEHNDFHLYYNQNHKIIFVDKSSPLYLRVLNPDSITSMQAANQPDYMDGFGYWKKNNLKAFYFLNIIRLNTKMNSKRKKQSFNFLMNAIKNSIVSLKNYNKVVITKNEL